MSHHFEKGGSVVRQRVKQPFCCLSYRPEILPYGLVMSDIHDGVYHGAYKAGRWSNKVAVTVNNKRITNIEIVDDVTFAKPEVSDALFSKVIDAQDTDVDAVSGATATCRAYLKSIENALNN